MSAWRTEPGVQPVKVFAVEPCDDCGARMRWDNRRGWICLECDALW